MKRNINKIAIAYVVLSVLFFVKIIRSDIGMILYASITILFMFFVLFVNKKNDQA